MSDQKQDAGAQCPKHSGVLEPCVFCERDRLRTAAEEAQYVEQKALEHAARLEEQRDRLRAALEMIYDKWENGDPCYEDPETMDGRMGNAVNLSYEEENEILALIPSRPSKREAKG